MSTTTDAKETADAVTRTRIIAATAKQEGRTFALLYTDDIQLVLKRLSEIEGDCEELLS